MAPFVESNDIPADDDASRSRADRDGYLFLRDFVDREPILEAQRDIAATLQDVGWIDAGTDPCAAKTSHPARIAGTDEHKPVYDRVQKLESRHTLAHNDALFRIARALLGPDVLLQPSNIARFIFPTGLDYPTPPHQDYVHAQGTPDVGTAWLPPDDCPHKLGGLSLQTDSHRVGVLPVSRALGAGGLRTHTEGVAGEWLSSPFGPGDVLIFHSHTVHQGLPNLSSDRLRLSVDFRYQKAADPVMAKMLAPLQYRLSWSEVYADWKSDKYQFYWKKFPLRPVPKQVWPIEN
ncbi:MAG: phytanoyl-CoA dioxygenase family protein [Candidatus Latescibacteria bacterium]|jgi:ectoine hydroxylase-related dioxygenase (phytanoyl-CoA dioxygenase family)|nr:phytanoyl-CoA dioxygenase family protein [Candidatus Latescibacterota bacterium]